MKRDPKLAPVEGAPGFRAARHASRVTLHAASAILLLAACQREEPAPPRAPAVGPTVHAAVLEVRTAEVPIRIEVTGQVAAASQATLSSQIQAAVEDLPAREGAAVTKGQTLVVLDSRDLRAEAARAEAEVENARMHLERMERLFKEDSVAKQELDNATRAFKVAEAGKRAALAKLSYTVIKAPFDGVITERRVEVGELASPGQPLLKMEDPTHLRLEATVAERDIQAIVIGAMVPVVVDAVGPAPLQGTVSRIRPSGDPSTHTFLVKLDLPSAPGLKSGMFGRMQLDKGSATTITVPKAAVSERGELTGVYVVGVDGLAHLRWIKAGRTFRDSVEILSGLNVGERILADASKGVDGARVEAVTAQPRVNGQ
jgi:RND family efflux transporter MFP subunit